MAILHLVVFQYHCLMIFWSHFKCMTTEPGVLPKNYDTLSFKKIAPVLAETILNVKRETARLVSDHSNSQSRLDQIEKQITNQIKNIDSMNEKQVQESKFVASVTIRGSSAMVPPL